MKSSKNLINLKKRLLAGIGTPNKVTFEIDNFQKQAIELVTAGEDTLVVAPTGSGKTFIALTAIESILEQRQKAVYTTPLKALSNSKYLELKARFEPRFKVGILTGDRKIQSDADVVVATTEIYRNELYRSSERFSLVVLDEVHYISDPQRGPVWEESIILTPQFSTLLMLSASISNSKQIAGWISEVRGKKCKIVIKEDRPVELRFGFLHPELGILPLKNDRGETLLEIQRFYSYSRDSGEGATSGWRKRSGYRNSSNQNFGRRRRRRKGV
ncbi:MAG TPA: DEAD/DEAH box helicase [Oligoflexia bacterium]|nr:DEAD/DEAH box helicase [Oligoflexia bacterium]HMP27853.1 DEAD/DEAH box helicase [Oligoflexia bacterium]